jgi:hypothetical protein
VSTLSTPRRRFLTTRPQSSESLPELTKSLAEICTPLPPAAELSFSDSRVLWRKSLILLADVEAVVAVEAVETDRHPAVVLLEVLTVDRDNPSVREPERAVALSRTRMNSPAFERVSSH